MADDISLSDLEAGAAKPTPAQAAAVVGANANPDQAAQSHQLSQVTGVPASFIETDPKGFVEQQKQTAAGAMVAQSPRLQQYIQDNPIAAKVSNDDYTNLDDFGKHLDAYPKESDLQGLIRGFSQGFDYPSFDKENTVSDNPLIQAAADSAALPLATGSLVSHAFGGVIGAGSAYLADQYSRITGDWDPVNRANNERNLSSIFEWMVQRGDAGAGHSFVSDGVEPPAGAAPGLDAIKAAQNESDLAHLNLALNQAQVSKTKVRAPDLFHSFAEQHVKDQYIGIDPDGVSQLYGNEVPLPGDQKLGFVPDIGTQILRAGVTGGDIHVPLGLWMTHATPWLEKALHEFIRTRPGNVTAREAGPLMDYHGIPREVLSDTGLGGEEAISGEAVYDDTLESLRKAAGLPTLKSLFDRAKAIGLTEAQMKRWAKLIDKQQQKDFDWKREKFEEAERKRQTKDWKDNRVRVRQEVVQNLKTDPAFVADAVLRQEAGPRTVKINPDLVTEAQREGLPNNYFSRSRGYDPEQIADIAGFETADDMFAKLRDLHANRGTIPPEEWRRRVIDSTTDQEMERRYGNLDRNILDSVYDHMFDETTLDLLHEDIRNLAEATGQPMPMSREEFQQMVVDQVGTQRIGTVKSADYLNASRKLSPVIDQLIHQNPTEAIKAQQKQFASFIAAKEAQKIEKEMKKFDGFTKTWKKREVSGALQEYTDQIHSVFQKLGLPVKRSTQDLVKELRAGGKNLQDFINDKWLAGAREINMPDFVMDPHWSKDYKDLTVNEFRETRDGLSQMAFHAKDEQKIIREGNKVDYEDTLKEMIAKLDETYGGEKKRIPTVRERRPIKDAPKGLWGFINMESMLDRLDDWDPKGIFNQTFTRMYTASANERETMLKEYDKKFAAAVGPQEELGNLDEKVPNTLWVDPQDGMPLDLTRRNVLGMLNHIGNKSNLEKLAGGYKLKPEEAKAWILSHVSQGDVDRAQRIGDVFNELFDKADQMSRRATGIGIDPVRLVPFQAGSKNYKGWYSPVKYDPLRPGGATRKVPDQLLENEYFRVAPSKQYTQKRTEYIAPLHLTLDNIGATARQMIHDTTMRESFMQLAKFFNDPRFEGAVRQYAGNGIADNLKPFLRQVANTGAPDHPTLQGLKQFGSQILSNMTSGLIQFNPATVMKHGTTAMMNSIGAVGPKNFAVAFRQMFEQEKNGQSMIQSAWEKSDELKRRWRNFAEVMAPQEDLSNLFVGTGKGAMVQKFKTVQEIAAYFGSAPIAIADLFSSVPTWTVVYRNGIGKGLDEGQAIYEADKAVRTTHGSTIYTNRPAALVGLSPIAQSFTKFYNFYNEILQKQYATAVTMKQAYKLGLSGDVLGTAKKFSQAAGMFTMYTIMPAVIDEMVGGIQGQNRKESLAKHITNVMLNGVASGIPIVRDIAHGFVRGDYGEAGLLGEAVKAFQDPVTDILPDKSGHIKALSPAKTGIFLKHIVRAVGYVSGLPGLMGGNLAEYTWNLFHNRDHANSLGDIYRGLTTGTARVR